MLYWPMAKTESGETLFTYEAAMSEEACVRQFETWEDHYGNHIKEAWVDSDDGRTYYERTWRKKE